MYKKANTDEKESNTTNSTTNITGIHETTAYCLLCGVKLKKAYESVMFLCMPRTLLF